MVQVRRRRKNLQEFKNDFNEYRKVNKKVMKKTFIEEQDLRIIIKNDIVSINLIFYSLNFVFAF